MSRCFAIKTLHTESFDQSELTALKWLSLQDQSRSYLSQTQTIDLGTLRLGGEDIINMKKHIVPVARLEAFRPLNSPDWRVLWP